MSNPLQTVVVEDQRISEALGIKDSYRLQRPVDLYRGSYDKDAFVATLMTRLMLEHDRRRLATQHPQ